MISKRILAIISVTLLAVGLMAGYTLGALTSPITETTTKILTKTEHHTTTLTIKGDQVGYIMTIDLISRSLKADLDRLTTLMAERMAGKISSEELAEGFQNSSKSIQILIDQLLDNPPPEKYMDDYRRALLGLTKLKISHELIAKSLRENDKNLYTKAMEIQKQALADLSWIILMP